MIHWTPISEMPAELRDGRDVLVWIAWDRDEVCKARWHRGVWRGPYGDFTDADITHYSEINEPEGVR